MMGNRRKTPSLMDDLLGGKKKDSKPVKQDTSLAVNHTIDSSDESAITKATYYISDDILLDLDTIQVQLRRLLKNMSKQQLSKSAIVEAALRLAVAEFKRNGNSSELVEVLLSAME